MKKRAFTSLSLNKKTISSLKILSNIKGGWTDWPETAKYCPEPAPQDPDPDPWPLSVYCYTWFGIQCPI